MGETDFKKDLRLIKAKPSELGKSFVKNQDGGYRQWGACQVRTDWGLERLPRYPGRSGTLRLQLAISATLPGGIPPRGDLHAPFRPLREAG